MRFQVENLIWRWHGSSWKGRRVPLFESSRECLLFAKALFEQMTLALQHVIAYAKHLKKGLQIIIGWFKWLQFITKFWKEIGQVKDKQKSKGRCEDFISSKSVFKLEFYQVTLLNATKKFCTISLCCKLGTIKSQTIGCTFFSVNCHSLWSNVRKILFFLDVIS